MTEREEINKVWKEKWDEGRSPWHQEETNPHLKEFFHLLDDGNLKGKRIFLPLCGKTVDLKWLYDHGMSVVGVDVVELAVKGFFEDNNLDYQIEDSPLLPDCKIYRHDDRLSIFVCDIFKVDAALLGGPCDYLWDRGALVAMVYDEQQKYWNIVDSILSPTAQALIECFEFDRTQHPGPPHSIPEDDLLQLLHGKFVVEQVCHRKNEDLPEGYATSHPALVESIRTMYYIKRMQ